MLAPPLVVVVAIISTSALQPPKSPPKASVVEEIQTRATQKQPGASQPKADSQTPIQITVAAPQKTPQEQQDERDQRIQNQAIQGAQVRLTGYLALLALVQLLIMGWQALITKRQNDIMDGQTNEMRTGVKLTRRSVNVARRTAETARDSLVMLNRPYLDTDNWTVELLQMDTKGGRPFEYIAAGVHLVIRFAITNPSVTSARLESFEVYHLFDPLTGASAAPNTGYAEQRRPNAIVSPKRGFPVVMPIFLNDLRQAQYTAKAGGGLEIQIRGRFVYSDRFGSQHWKTFHQRCHCNQRGFMFEPIDGGNQEDGWDRKSDPGSQS